MIGFFKIRNTTLLFIIKNSSNINSLSFAWSTLFFEEFFKRFWDYLVVNSLKLNSKNLGHFSLLKPLLKYFLLFIKSTSIHLQK